MNLPSEHSSPKRDSDSRFRKPSDAETSSLPTLAPVGKTAREKTPTRLNPKSVSSAESKIDSLLPTIDTEAAPIELTVSKRILKNRSQLSSILTSTLAHTIVFLILALWMMEREVDPTIGLLASFEMAEVDVEPAITPSPIKIETPDVAESPVDSIADSTDDAVEEMAANDVPELTDSVVEAESVDDTVAVVDAARKTLPLGGGLQGRDAKSRSRLAAQFGGSAGSEAAVELGLRWIINHQLTDGSWRFRHHKSDCDGRCGNEGRIDAPTAATGLALMSLMGAGYTHKKGPYQYQIESGLDFLESRVRYLNYGATLGGSGPQPMYAHAIATIALAEAVAMTGDEDYRKVIEEAYRYIATAQHQKGGWKYKPQQPGDMSVTGWQMMAVKACHQAGVAKNAGMLTKAKSFVDSLSHTDDAAYGYEIDPAGDVKFFNLRKPSCTAIGHLMQMYFDTPLESPELISGCDLLAQAGPADTDMYFNYYATLVLHHGQSPHWKKWNQTVREHLIRTQQKHGHEAGSWFFPDQHGDVGGRLYTTAMAVMTLEVYYRFMPLYEVRGEEKVRKSVAE